MEGKILTEKQLCRKSFLNERAKLLPEYKKRADQIICKNVISSAEYGEALNIFLYAANEYEISTDYIAQDALSQGRNIFYPKVLSDGKMDFYQVTDLKKDLAEGYKGIYEPKDSCPRAAVKPDIIIVPGVAFDRDFHRMGYGKGFYDRYFCETKYSAVRAALCYSQMLKSEIPSEAHDELMDMIITEEEIWKRKNYSLNT